MEKLFKKFNEVVVWYYWVILLIITSLACACLCLLLLFATSPDFTDPKNGFETRGTDISDSSLAYDALLKRTYGVSDYYNDKRNSQREAGKGINNNEDDNDESIDDDSIEDESIDGDSIDDDDGEDNVTDNNIGENENNMNAIKANIFCGKPEIGHSKLIFEGVEKNEDGLMNIKSIHSMCKLEEKLIKKGFKNFNKYCDKKILKFEKTSKNEFENGCCISWNLGNYIALVSGKTSCMDVNQGDVDRFKVFVRYCGAGGLCRGNETCTVLHCNDTALDVDVFDMVRVKIIDKDYMKKEKLKYVMSHLSLSKGLASREFYKSIKIEGMLEENVKLVAMDFDLKEEVFDEYLKLDLFRSLTSFIGIVFILILYTGSIFITLFTLLNILISLIISTFIYHFIFNITFFPFLNLLAIIILYATGVDAIFVFLHIISTRDQHLPSNQLFSFQVLLTDRLQTAFAGFAASSAATFVAYVSAASSHVVVLRCFAIYASLSVVVHFFVTVLFIPSVMILNQKISFKLLSDFYSLTPCLKVFTNKHHTHFTTFLLFTVETFRVVFIVFFTLFTSILIISFGTHFNSFLPSIKDFNLLASWHPFEVFDTITTNHFIQDNFLDRKMNNLAIRFIWQMKTSNDLKQGVGFELAGLDLSSKQAQIYFRDICRLVRSSDYYTREVSFHKNNCFMDEYMTLMQRGCRNIDGRSLKPCCSFSQFPYQKKVFKICLRRFLPILARNTLLYSHKKRAGLRFNSNFTHVEALIVEFVSNVAYDSDYKELEEFHKNFMDFTNVNIHIRAPEGFKEGWFSSELEWLDLQKSLFNGLLTSLLSSFCAISLICTITTGFSCLTIFTILTITLSTTTSFLTLLLSGWTFNVFETMAFSLVIGLSIDFSLHNAAVSKHANHSSSQLHQVISINSALFLAGVTTAGVGVSYYGSVVIPYTQLATLLVTVVSFSWLYSTFFFIPLLSILKQK